MELFYYFMPFSGMTNSTVFSRSAVVAACADRGRSVDAPRDKGITVDQWHSSHRASALLSCDYFFDASHKLCYVWTLLDALTLLQVFKCGLESGLRDCGASQTY